MKFKIFGALNIYAVLRKRVSISLARNSLVIIEMAQINLKKLSQVHFIKTFVFVLYVNCQLENLPIFKKIKCDKAEHVLLYSTGLEVTRQNQ